MKMIQFIDQKVEVRFKTPPLYVKSPPCPDALFWDGMWHEIIREISSWTDFTRKGKMKRNMQPQHAARASSQGSWGVGRYSFQVETKEGRIFEIYFDRAPKDVDDRLGNWYLLGERVKNE